jgi:hypothetical protein
MKLHEIRWRRSVTHALLCKSKRVRVLIIDRRLKELFLLEELRFSHFPPQP